MIHNQHCNIYIASCTEKGGIYRCRMNTYGQLTFLDKTELDRPMYMTVSDNKMYILLRAPFSDNSYSGVVIYDIDSDGRLINPSTIQSTQGEVACHITVDNGKIYCANYISGSVVKFPDRLVTHKGIGKHPIRQTSPHVHYVCSTPDNNYLCAVDLGLDTIFVYNKDLTLFSSAKVPDGHGARHLVFSENGKNMFCVNELKSTLSVFGYTNGRLEIIDTVSILPKDFYTVSTAAAIRLYNNKIYASNRGHNSISELIYSNNKLTLERCIASGGKNPRDFNFINNFLVCANEESNNITVFDCKNSFSQIGEYCVERPLCVVEKLCYKTGGKI